MKLNHLDLPVSDLAGARDFFARHLGFRVLETRGRDGLAILQDEAGLVLVLSRLQDGDPPAYPAQFHIGFLQADEQAVHATHQRLVADGVEVGAVGRQRGGVMFYFQAPGPILVEISWRPS